MLYPYQANIVDGVYREWNAGHKHLAVISATGSGKTHIQAHIMNDVNGIVFQFAHRKELIGHISFRLAKMGVYHDIIAPSDVIHWISYEHKELVGRSFYRRGSPICVSSIDTVGARLEEYKSRLAQAALWVVDEGHHVIRDNKWGRVLNAMPNAYGIGFTATPSRTDKKGLGMHAHGFYTAMVHGPSVRWLIDNNYLSDYRMFCIPDSALTSFRKSDIGSGGEFKRGAVQQALDKSKIVGSVVDEYIKHAEGLRGMTFAYNIEEANKLVEEFIRRGVPATVVTGKTDPRLRVDTMRRFEQGKILQVVSVDVFGEGIDVPNLEVVSLGRPTESRIKYRQQCGRVLRYMPGKTATILDHVNNIRHGPPCADLDWSLDDGAVFKLRAENRWKVCTHCSLSYPIREPVCPGCGNKPIPADRSSPDKVDGVLEEVDPAELRKIWNKAKKNVLDPVIFAQHSGYHMHHPIIKNHTKRRGAQLDLREVVSWWAGTQVHLGKSTREYQQIFFYEFGTDMATALTLSGPDTIKLLDKLRKSLDRLNGIGL